jgi:hypothetical protein
MYWYKKYVDVETRNYRSPIVSRRHCPRPCTVCTLAITTSDFVLGDELWQLQPELLAIISLEGVGKIGPANRDLAQHLQSDAIAKHKIMNLLTISIMIMMMTRMMIMIIKLWWDKKG